VGEGGIRKSGKAGDRKQETGSRNQESGFGIRDSAKKRYAVRMVIPNLGALEFGRMPDWRTLLPPASCFLLPASCFLLFNS
jgi:hypothetical protein